MRVEIGRNVYDTKKAEPLLDYLARKERIVVYRQFGKYFCHGQEFQGDLAGEVKLEWMRFMPESRYEEIKRGLPPIEEGNVGMVFRPYQDYV